MNGNPWSVARSRYVSCGTALVVLACFVPATRAQDEVRRLVEIILDADKTKQVLTKEIDLRPKNETPIALELKNRAGEILGDVTIKVVQVVDGKNNLIAEARVEKLALDKGEIVELFTPVKGAPEKLAFFGPPPYTVQVHIQAKNLAPIKYDLKLTIREPREYVSAVARYTPGSRSLDISVTAADENAFVGRRSMPAELVIGPDISVPKSADTTRFLTKEAPKATVKIQDFGFERQLDRGDVYLRVDGYDRAFTYLVKENSNGAIDPRPFGETRVRIDVPRYSLPIKDFIVPVQIDGPLSKECKVEISLDRTGDGDPAAGPDLKVRDGLREQLVYFKVTKAGKLVCETDVRDWAVDFNTQTIINRNVWFRVQVLTKGPGGAFNQKAILVAVPESRPFKARTESDDRKKQVTSVYAMVTLDNTPPDGMKLILPPDKTWPIGAPLEVRASINPRRVDQAPIKQVIFYKGEIPKDAKDEKDRILTIDVLDPKQTEWKVTIPAQATPGVMPISVEFITHTGVRAGKTDAATFIALAKAPATKKGFKVSGTVVYSAGIPGLDVVLLDGKDKAKVKATTKSNKDGVFVFENVDPGTYFIWSEFRFQKLSGMIGPVEVPKNQKDVTGVELKLR